MSDSLPSSARVDRTVLSIAPNFDNSDDTRTGVRARVPNAFATSKPSAG